MNIICQRYETVILQLPQIHSLPAIRICPPKRSTSISIMQIHVLLAAALALSGTAFASPTKQQGDAAAVSSRNYFGSKNAPYTTMRPRSDEDWDDIAQVVCADPCCGEAEQEDGGKGDNCTFTNDPGGRANCLEMVTFLAGESGLDARAEKASAGTGKTTPGT